MGPMDPDAGRDRRSHLPWLVGALLVIVGVFVAVSRHAPPVGKGATTPLPERPAAPPEPASPFVPDGLPVEVVVPLDAEGQPYAGTVYALEAGSPGVDDMDVVPELLVTGAQQATLRVPFAGRYDIGFVPLEHAWSVLASDVEIALSKPASVTLERPRRLAAIRLAALDGEWPDEPVTVTVFAGDDGRPGRRRLPGREEQRTFTVKLTGWDGAARRFCERPVGEPTVIGLRAEQPQGEGGDATSPWVPFTPRPFVTIDPLLIVSWVRAATLDVHILVPDVHKTASVVVLLRGPRDEPRRATLDVRPGDRDTRFAHFEGLVPGTHAVTAFGEGLESTRAEITLEPGGHGRLALTVGEVEDTTGSAAEEADAPREIPVTLRGVPAGFEGAVGVFGSDPSRPDDLVGVEVAAEPRADSPLEAVVRLYRADAEGPFRAFAYAMPLETTGESLAAGPLELAVGAPTDVGLVPAGYVVPLVPFEANTAGSAPLRLVHAERVPLPTLTPEGVVVRSAVLAAGHPRIGPLPPGRVRFDVLVGRRRVGTVDVEVVAGEVVRFELP